MSSVSEYVDAVLANPRAWHYLRKVPELDYRRTKKRIRRVLGHIDGPVLDLGCGTGEYAPLFAPNRYVGIDLWPPFVRYASRRLGDFSFVVGDAQRLPFPDGGFPCVLVNGVIHHMDDDSARRLLAEVSRVVQPSGTVLIIEDIPSSGLNLPGRLMHALDQGDHIRTPLTYRSLIEPHLAIRRTDRYRSGICEYALFEAGSHG
jgi:SAM-dependent methyltransferase